MATVAIKHDLDESNPVIKIFILRAKNKCPAENMRLSHARVFTRNHQMEQYSLVLTSSCNLGYLKIALDSVFFD